MLVVLAELGAGIFSIKVVFGYTLKLTECCFGAKVFPFRGLYCLENPKKTALTVN